MDFIHPSQMTDQQRRENSAAMLDRFARAHELAAKRGLDKRPGGRNATRRGSERPAGRGEDPERAMRNDSVSRHARAKAHAKHAYFCSCGRVVHGNGARAMHFYVGGQHGDPRTGHGAITRDEFFRRFPDWRPDGQA